MLSKIRLPRITDSALKHEAQEHVGTRLFVSKLHILFTCSIGMPPVYELELCVMSLILIALPHTVSFPHRKVFTAA
jgi:hypothetical protein